MLSFRMKNLSAFFKALWFSDTSLNETKSYILSFYSVILIGFFSKLIFTTLLFSDLLSVLLGLYIRLMITAVIHHSNLKYPVFVVQWHASDFVTCTISL